MLNPTSTTSDETTAAIPCQVCGKRLTPRADGLARSHGRGGRCQGAGYRLARWPVGQHLTHYTGSVFEVLEDLGGPYGDYLVTCVWSQTNFNGGQMEEVGRERVFHGEYLHRHGWTPDLMGTLARSLARVRLDADGAFVEVAS